MDLIEITEKRYTGMAWIHQAHDSDHCLDLVNIKMSH
jgi:hypothetical protein